MYQSGWDVEAKVNNSIVRKEEERHNKQEEGEYCR